jgi:hypothetical protein
VIAPDGMIITPPGHEIQYLGAESKALRGEGYMKLLLNRVYGGLGVNGIVMGEGNTASAASADAMTVTMHNKAKFYQRQLQLMFTEFVLYELLLEGGWDPLLPADNVRWLFNEIETEALLKRENHAMQLWTNNGLTLDEFRRAIGKKPLPEGDEQKLYVYVAKIPEIEAKGMIPGPLPDADGAKKQVGSRDNPSNQHGPRGAPKIRPK